MPFSMRPVPVKMKKALEGHAAIQAGEAVVTPGFNLPAKHVIHAVGPRYQDGRLEEEDRLSSAYRNSLDLAVKLGCKSIAFPLISSGIFGYPKEQVVEVAIRTIRKFLQHHEIKVYLSVINNENIFQVARKLAAEN